MRSVAIISTVLVLAACGGDADPDSGTPGAASGPLGELEAEDRAVVEELSEVLTDDPDIDTEELERAAELSADAVAAAVAIDLPPCELLTVEEVEAITGYEVGQVTEHGPIDCLYDLVAESDLYLLASVDDAQGRIGGPAGVLLWHDELGQDSPYEPIEGVGERAIYGARQLVVDAGDGRYFSVGVSGQYLEFADALDEMIALAELGLQRVR